MSNLAFDFGLTRLNQKSRTGTDMASSDNLNYLFVLFRSSLLNQQYSR
jgi:hypothetical protein